MNPSTTNKWDCVKVICEGVSDAIKGLGNRQSRVSFEYIKSKEAFATTAQLIKDQVALALDLIVTVDEGRRINHDARTQNPPAVF